MKEDLSLTPQGPHLSFSTWLQDEFSERCQRNPRYSLRAFAGLLNSDASSLSKYMSGKRKPSRKMILRFCEALQAKPEQREKLLFDKPDISEQERDQYYQLQVDQFKLLSDWYHIAILELSLTDDFQSEPRFIARRLGITTEQAKMALSRLERLGVMEKMDGCYVKTQKNLSTYSHGVTSAAHKEYQKQVIKKALDAVGECPQELKDITSISMAIDVNKLDQARLLIEKFRKDMCAFLESGDSTEVYNMSIQLYPITQTIQKGKDQ